MLEESVTYWNDPGPPVSPSSSESFLGIGNAVFASPTQSAESSGGRFGADTGISNANTMSRALPLTMRDADSTSRGGSVILSKSTTPPQLTTITPLNPTPTPPTPQRQSTKRTWTATDFIRSDFWFHDGNIVIIAGQAAFKVHRGQLERHSEVFAGLFGLPQPSGEEQDLVDGCPSVVWYDEPEDVFYFLSALYDGLYFKVPRANDFPAIAAVLRLSTKYMVESLRVRCLHRLHLDWPTTLWGWDQREAGATDDMGRYLPRESWAHPILVVELALEMGLESVLPAALYDLSRYGPSRILAGVKRPVGVFEGGRFGCKVGRSGTMAEQREVGDINHNNLSPSPFPSPSPSLATKSSSRIIQLAPSLLLKTLRGRESSQRYTATFLAKELCGRAPAVDCMNKHDPVLQRYCLESFYYIMLNVLRSVGGIACGRDADPLFTLVQALEMLSRTDFTTAADSSPGAGGGGSPFGVSGEGNAEGGGRVKKCGLKMCTMCKVDFARAVARAREEVWNLLPTWFGLV